MSKKEKKARRKRKWREEEVVDFFCHLSFSSASCSESGDSPQMGHASPPKCKTTATTSIICNHHYLCQYHLPSPLPYHHQYHLLSPLPLFQYHLGCIRDNSPFRIVKSGFHCIHDFQIFSIFFGYES